MQTILCYCSMKCDSIQAHKIPYHLLYSQIEVSVTEPYCMVEESDTERATVMTYVPVYQKAEWKAHAEELGMSQAEYVRTMVQAGRKGFELDTESPDLERSSGGSNPGGHGLETRVLDALDSGVLSWEELVDALSSNFEDRLEETLESLQAENRIRYSGREGGYTVVDQ